MKVPLLLLLTLLALLLPLGVWADHGPLHLNLDYPAFGPYDLNDDQSLPEIVAFFYYFIVGISGLAAFVMLVVGGIQWLVSGAAPGQASEARDKIRNAILGLLLILASVLIIQVINPELTVINLAALPGGEGSIPELPPLPPGPVSSFGLLVNGDIHANILPGKSVIFTWTTTGGFTSCDATNDFSGEVPPQPSWVADDLPPNSSLPVVIGPFDNETPVGNPLFYALRCRRPGHQAIDVVSVAVSSIPPIGDPPTIDQFEVKPRGGADDEWTSGPVTYVPGEDLNFRWSSTDATLCLSLGALLTAGPDPNGTSDQSASVFEETETYTLQCSNDVGAVSQDIIITTLF